MKKMLYLAGCLLLALALPVIAQDFSKPEPGEDKPGGEATSRKSVNNSNAFSHFSGNMRVEDELTFKIGNGIFKKLWVSAPASTKSSDGLGPLFNARACQNCHLKDGRGHPPQAENEKTANAPYDANSFLIRLSIPAQTEEQRTILADHKSNAIPDPVYGGQLQDLAIQGHEAEGKIKVTYTESTVSLNGGESVSLRKPTYEITDLKYGPLHKEIRLSPRIAPQMIGLGLLEAIPQNEIEKLADPDDRNKDGTSGHPNLIWSKEYQKIMIGRFGWKAGQPSIKEQSAGAFSGDMGLSSIFAPEGSGDCTKAQAHCFNAPNGNSPDKDQVEVENDVLDLITFYSQNLAVPARRTPDHPDILQGKKLFHMAGCAACHQPSFKTGEVKGQAHLSNQLIWPYTDMLLHDMGEDLADNSPEGVANGREWRTAPLWGIGLTEIVNGHTLYLHDGRARNITEAILWHGGEAQKSRDAFIALGKEDREKLIAFVKSL